MNAVAFADISSQILFSGGDDAICKVWDRRTMREDDPKPVGALAGHQDGITFIDSKVGREADLYGQVTVCPGACQRGRVWELPKAPFWFRFARAGV